MRAEQFACTAQSALRTVPSAWWAAYSGTLAALIHLRGVRFLTDKKLETSGGIVTPRRNCPQTPWDSLRSLLADSVPGRAWGCRQK